MDFSQVKTVAIDFDGVIHQNDMGWCDGDIYGNPVKGSLESINKLIKKGFIPVVFTARTEMEPVRTWLKFHNFPELEVTNIKPPAISYIDDRGVRFTNWTDILNYFV